MFYCCFLFSTANLILQVKLDSVPESKKATEGIRSFWGSVLYHVAGDVSRRDDSPLYFAIFRVALGFRDDSRREDLPLHFRLASEKVMA